MFFRRLIALVTCACGLAVLPNAGYCWGHDGHRIAAAIAIKLLPPEKAAALDGLLRTSELKVDFIEAAGYADDVLRQTHDFDLWHYVNWPDDSSNTGDQSCEPICILKALAEQTRGVRGSGDPEDRALALSWIIHLIGDLHQPLHVADRDHDAGGNHFPVTYQGRSKCGPSSWPPALKFVQLHKVWDDCLVLTLRGNSTIEETADAIRGNLSTYRDHPFARGTQRDWAKESHALAHTYAYADLEKEDDIGDEYINRALPIVRDQLLKAGIRLARTIDQNM